MAQSNVNQSRVEQFKNSRFNPIRYLTPESLSEVLQQFDYGSLEWPAQVLLEIMERDQITSAVASKRRMKAESFGWEIAKKPDADDAEFERQREVLKYAYDNLIATDALDKDKRRGIQGLFGDMNVAQGMKWQVFEIIAKPTTKGLTFELVACPLSFFENRTGKLRYLPQSGRYDGIDMADAQWMVVRGLYLMKPTAIAYMFARIPKDDWLFYNEAHACPGIIGTTNAQIGQPAHTALVDLVAQAGTPNFKGVINDKEKIEAIQFGSTGALPFEPLIEQQHRLISTIWLGGDLSTMSSSKPGQVGSTNQSEDQKCIEDHDAQVITETLNMKLDRLILEYHFGPDVEVAAYIRVKPKREPNIDAILKRKTALIDWGADVGIDSTREELNEPKPEKGEPIFQRQQAAQPTDETGAPTNNFDAGNAANETRKATDSAMLALQNQTIKLMTAADAEKKKPLADRLLGILELPTQEAQRAALAKLKNDWPSILHEMNMASGKAIDVLEGAQLASFLNGVSESVVATQAANARMPAKPKKQSFTVKRDTNGDMVGFEKVEVQS